VVTEASKCEHRQVHPVSSPGVSNREVLRASGDFTGAGKQMSPIAPESATGADSDPSKRASVPTTAAPKVSRLELAGGPPVVHPPAVENDRAELF
jgi:hypothetical protein